MKDRKKAYYNVSDSKLLRPLLSNVYLALAIHWVFQGMLYMDRTERFFKLGLDIIMAVPMALLFSIWLPPAISILTGILVAHSVNFLLNGHVWVVLKHFDFVHNSREEFDRVLYQLSQAIRNEPSIQEAYVYGSVVRGEWKRSSDIDVRLIRRRGFFFALKACMFATLVRMRALKNKFPMDIYVFDTKAALKKMRADEAPYYLVNDFQRENE